jgi:cellulose synthase/poly-beta-1,6-N-acetylglucosamine synthase-like glycosyltransferase
MSHKVVIMMSVSLAWVDADALRWALTIAYLTLLGLIAAYGLHRYWLVYLFKRHLRDLPRHRLRYKQLPAVTVQLPIFNEGAVARRIIDAACRLRYPADRLQIQVLDDSTDASAEVNRRHCETWQQRGVDIQYLQRTDRVGYKAGALAAAMEQATGELIAILDADFVPPTNFLRRTVHYFTDPKLGMVQTRWSHINRDDSLLTRGQAIFLDGHFVIEHTARNRSGAWINFNGTAGLWRREAIEEAGGWQHDTLTEDVDLSYRAQLCGWKFLFLPWVTCPAELPPEINAFKSQQHRWTKGSIQTAIKLLPTVLRADVGLKVKIEAIFHLTNPMVYLYITLLALLFFPAIYVNLDMVWRGSWLGVLLGMALFVLGSISATVFYLTSQQVQRRKVWTTLIQVPMLMAIGIGIALNNAIACIEALLGHESPFVRTPKYNCIDETGAAKRTGRLAVIAIPSMKWSLSLLEIGMGLYMLQCVRMAMVMENAIVSLPFLLLFAWGYFYVGCTSLWTHLRARIDARRQPVAQVQTGT